jgi:HTH-type transcriptional regulator/antitoxin HipB
MNDEKIRKVFLYKSYFSDFYEKQNKKVRNKILRIFCFFDEGKLIVILNGFNKKTQKTPRSEIVKAFKIKKYMKQKSNLKSLDKFINEQYGNIGESKRDNFEKGFESFKIGVLLQQARLEKGMTQEELAEKCGTNKGYISKIENNIKEVRISTLQKIVELGLDGRLELSIKL